LHDCAEPDKIDLTAIRELYTCSLETLRTDMSYDLEHIQKPRLYDLRLAPSIGPTELPRRGSW
jgi:hypothetical protein